jgi:hypothetical protein
VIINIIVLWSVVSYSLVDTFLRFEGTYCLNIEVVGYLERSLCICQTTWPHHTEDNVVIKNILRLLYLFIAKYPDKIVTDGGLE